MLHIGVFDLDGKDNDFMFYRDNIMNKGTGATLPQHGTQTTLPPTVNLLPHLLLLSLLPLGLRL